jgi:hypothetical protein
MKVRALRMGFYGHQRYRPGEVFEMADAHAFQRDAKKNVKKDEAGKPMLCSWIEVAEPAEETPEKRSGRRGAAPVGE